MKNKYTYLFTLFILVAFYGNTKAQTTVLSQDFESGVIPPAGWVDLQGGTGNLWTTVSYGSAHGGTGAAEYKYNTTNAANTWLISSGVALTAGVTYTISYWENTGSFNEKLSVTVGTAQTIAGQATTLQNITIANTSYAQQSVTYTAPSTTTYYFGWQCHSAKNENYLDIDDILVTYCTAPGNDACSSATNLGTITSGAASATTAGTNACASADQIGGTCFSGGSGTINANVWYKFTTDANPGAASFTLAVASGMQYPQLAIYSGGCGGTQVTCSGYTNVNNAYLTTSCLSANTTYYVQVDNYSTYPTGSFNLTYSVTLKSAVAAIGGGAATVCVGATTPAFTDATGGGTWSVTNGTGSATISAGGIVTGVSAGNATVVYSVGCASATYALTINPLPTVAAIGGGAASVCVGATTPAFTDATAGGTWSITNGTGSATITAGGVVTGVTGGNVTVNYAVTNGCGTTTVTYALTISPLPTVAAIGGGTNPLCVGSQSANFSDATGGGIWTETDGTGSATLSVKKLTGVSAGIVNINYAVTNGCGTTTVTYPITIVGPPANDVCASATDLGTITSGAAAATIAGYNSCATIDQSPGSCFSGGGGSINANVWYQFTTDANPGAASFSVTVVSGMQRPQIAVYSGGCGGTQVSCAGYTNVSNAYLTTSCLSPNTTYYVQVDNYNTYPNGSFNLTYSVSAVSALAAIGGGAAAVCVGATTPAFTDASGGGTWSVTNSGGSATISAGGVLTGVASGTVTVVYSIGCNTSTYVVTVNAPPTVAAITGGGSNVCLGNTVPAFTDATGGGTWSVTNGTGSITIDGSQVVTGVSVGTASVNYAVTNGCGTTTLKYPITVLSSVCSGTPTGGAAEPSVIDGCSSYASTISLSGATVGFCGLSYQWYSSADNNTWASIAGATSTSYAATVSSSTYYQCVVTCANSGLSATSSSGYCQFGAATNDICTSPVAAGVISAGGYYNIQGDNTCATLNTGGITDPSPTCQFSNHKNTLWYSFTTPAYALSYSVSLVTSSMQYGAIALYSGSCGAFAQIGCTDAGVSYAAQTISTACLAANTTYYVMVFIDAGTAGTFNLSITAPTCSAGNSEATKVTSCGAGNYSSTISLANTSACLTSYQWQTSTDNSTWSNIGGATASTYAATVSADTYYQCVVTCSDGSTSTSSSVYCSAPNTAPTNDICANAIALTFQPGINIGDYIARIQGDNSCATADGTSTCFTANKSIWYKFTAPVDGSYNVMIQSAGTMRYPELSIKNQNTTCAGFTEASCAGVDNATGNFWESGNPPTYFAPNGYSPYSLESKYYAEAGICNVTLGSTVYIMVDDYQTAGSFTLTVGTLENDAIPNGVVVNNCGSLFNSSTIGATNCGNCSGTPMGGGEPATVGIMNDLDCNSATICNGSSGASCGNGSGSAGSAEDATYGVNGADVGYSVENDSWYQFCTTAASAVQLNFNPITSSCLPSSGFGGSGGLQISIFTGTSGNLTKINGGFNSMAVTANTLYTFNLAANQCCFVEVDGFAGTNCNYQLSVSMSPGCVLPVDILSFNGVLTNDIKVKLNWVTASEVNSDHYIVERSTDGVDYSPIGTVKAVGNSTTQFKYELYDNYPVKGINYYKLSEFDKNGLESFLGYATVRNTASLPFLNLYPNPAQNSITLSLKNFANPMVSYGLYNAQGELLKMETINLIDGNQDYKIDLSELNQGFYFIKVNSGDELLKKTFVKVGQ